MRELSLKVAALFTAALSFGTDSRPVVIGLLVAAVLVWQLARLSELAEGRRLWRFGDDPVFQGDGWRWTLSLLLPNLLLWRAPDGCPFTLDMLVLTDAQTIACRKEWQATQAQYERWEREGGGPDVQL